MNNDNETKRCVWRAHFLEKLERIANSSSEGSIEKISE